jgi:hypothetical protein
MTDPAWLIYMYTATYDLSEHSEYKILTKDKLPKTLGRVLLAWFLRRLGGLRS